MQVIPGLGTHSLEKAPYVINLGGIGLLKVAFGRGSLLAYLCTGVSSGRQTTSSSYLSKCAARGEGSCGRWGGSGRGEGQKAASGRGRSNYNLPGS